MPNKLQLYVIHCTATPEGRNITPDNIKQWHLAPYQLTKEDIANELKKTTDPKLIQLLKNYQVLKYNGSFYRNPEELPDQYLGGISIRKIQGRGWSQVGYSDSILLDGTVVNLVPYNNDDNVDRWEVTNGATGINGIARHIVYAGGTDANGKAKDTRTALQLDSLERQVRKTIAMAPDVKVAGHNQFAQKDCPSFHVPDWCKAIGISTKNIYTK